MTKMTKVESCQNCHEQCSLYLDNYYLKSDEYSLRLIPETNREFTAMNRAVEKLNLRNCGHGIDAWTTSNVTVFKVDYMEVARAFSEIIKPQENHIPI